MILALKHYEAMLIPYHVHQKAAALPRSPINHAGVRHLL